MVVESGYIVSSHALSHIVGLGGEWGGSCVDAGGIVAGSRWYMGSALHHPRYMRTGSADCSWLDCK